jgi:hypothetical protein
MITSVQIVKDYNRFEFAGRTGMEDAMGRRTRQGAASTLAREEPGIGTIHAPVVPQILQEGLGQQAIAILLEFALHNGCVFFETTPSTPVFQSPLQPV